VVFSLLLFVLFVYLSTSLCFPPYLCSAARSGLSYTAT
jgi:hypothetical protein